MSDRCSAVPEPPRRTYIWLVASPTAMVKRGQLAACTAMQVMSASSILWLAAKGLRLRSRGGGDPACMPSRFHTWVRHLMSVFTHTNHFASFPCLLLRMSV